MDDIRPRVAFVMMQKDEGRLLETWLWYYCGIAYPRDLFILDNGSTEPHTTGVLRRFELLGVNVDRGFATEADYQRKGDIVRDKILAINEGAEYDFVIPLDCDEFLGIEAGASATVEPASIWRELQRVRGKTGHFSAKGSYFNVPNEARRFFYYAEKTVFFGPSRVTWLEHGYHDASTVAEDGAHPTDLVVIHLHFKKLALAQRQAKEKMRARIADFEPETLRDFSGPRGSHLVNLLKLTPETYTLGAVGGASPIAISSFYDYLDRSGIEFPTDLTRTRHADGVGDYRAGR